MFSVLIVWLCGRRFFLDFFIVIILFVIGYFFIAAEVAGDAFHAFDVGGAGEFVEFSLRVEVLEAFCEEVVFVLIDVVELGDVVLFGEEVDFLKVARGDVAFEVDSLFVGAEFLQVFESLFEQLGRLYHKHVFFKDVLLDLALNVGGVFNVETDQLEVLFQSEIKLAFLSSRPNVVQDDFAVVAFLKVRYRA